MDQHPDQNGVGRRQFLKTAGAVATGLAGFSPALAAAAKATRVVIKDVRIEKGVRIEANDGTFGSFAGSSAQDLKTLATHLVRIRERWLGRDPFDPKLEGQDLWDAI